MLQPEEIRWTSRTEVCDKLLQLVRHPSPSPDSGAACEPEAEAGRRCRTIELFALLADESFVPVLRELLRDPLQPQPARMEARRALVRLEAELPVEELTALLHDHTLWAHPVHFYNIADLLELFRSEEAQRAARTVLESWSATDRAQLLYRLGLSDPPQELVDWLYHRWLNEDRWLTGDVQNENLRIVEDVQEYFDEPLNCSLAIRHLKRPGARAVLLEYWRRAEGDRREELREELWDFDEGVPAAWVAGNPDELKELAETFKLAHAGLVDYFGAEPLQQIVDQKLREVSRQRRAEPEDYSPVHTQEFLRIVGIMAEWPEPGVRERIRSLFCCPDVETEVRWEFCHYLWEGQRDEVVSLALAAGRQAGDLELPARILRWLVDDPRAADRELLWWSVGQDANWQLPYWAVQGLERLGEDSGQWRQRLEDLSRSRNPFVRLHAAAGLVRRGDEAWLQEIVSHATAAEDSCVRGEAIRVLGELGLVQHLDLIRRALWAEEPVFVVRDDPDDGKFAQSFIPVAEEAGLALARLGTPEAMTALLQGFLFLPSGDPQFQLGYHLQAIVARLDGRTEPFDTMPWTGWRQERFGRLPQLRARHARHRRPLSRRSPVVAPTHRRSLANAPPPRLARFSPIAPSRFVPHPPQ